MLLVLLFQFFITAQASVECSWVESEPPLACPDRHSCCPWNEDAGEWGCCEPESFCYVSGDGSGQCCIGNVTNCSPVTVEMEEEDLDYSGSDLALAFGLTTGAGASTVLGVILVLFVEETTSTTILGYALSFAAGVMIYISFVEILGEALHHFESKYEDSEALARFMAALSFFSGMLFGYGINVLVHRLENLGKDKVVMNDAASLEENPESQDHEDQEIQALETEKGGTSPHHHHELNLLNISLVTALAVGLHNVPEGLVTFVSTLYSPHTGVAIAVAIAIHNVPEGIAIAAPVYYQSGSLCKAFFWAFISGIAEPLGALLGYLILDSMFGPVAFGWMFGSVGGIMVYISFAELLPVAYQTSAQYPTLMVFLGMVVMEISLILFNI